MCDPLSKFHSAEIPRRTRYFDALNRIAVCILLREISYQVDHSRTFISNRQISYIADVWFKKREIKFIKKKNNEFLALWSRASNARCARIRVSLQPDAQQSRVYCYYANNRNSGWSSPSPSSSRLDVFIVGLAIPLPKLFCFEAPGYASEAILAPGGFRSRACESFTVKLNRATERPRENTC